MGDYQTVLSDVTPCCFGGGDIDVPFYINGWGCAAAVEERMIQSGIKQSGQYN